MDAIIGLVAAACLMLAGLIVNKVWSSWRNNKPSSNPGPMREDCRTMFGDIKTSLGLFDGKLDDIRDRVTKIEAKLE